MKKYIWMLIVGGIVTLGSFGLFSESVFGGIVLLLLGGGLIALFFIILARKKKSDEAAQAEPAPKIRENISFKVAGVSFSNDDGKSRQDIIKEIKRSKEAYIRLERYEYNGKPAIAVYADGEKIGNVPSDLVDRVNKAWTKSYTLVEMKVLGSGKEAPFGVYLDFLFE